MLLHFLNSYVLNCTYSYRNILRVMGEVMYLTWKVMGPPPVFPKFSKAPPFLTITQNVRIICATIEVVLIVIIITIIGLFNRRKHYKELKHYTVTPSFQIAKVHPPTVSSISLKKGDLCRVVMGPSCANHTCSGRGAKEKRQFTFIICSCSKQS